MPETLLTPSSIKLYGRLMKSLLFTNDTTAFGGNYFLQRQLAVNVEIDNITGDIDGYSISNLGPLDAFARLTVGMTIKEKDVDVDSHDEHIIVKIGHNSVVISHQAAARKGVHFVATIRPFFARIYGFSFEGAFYPLPRPSMFLVHGRGLPTGSWNNNSTLDEAGVAAREWDFSGKTGPADNPKADDLRYWEYEKGDFSLRLDLEAGPFEQILLQMALRSGADRADRSGAGVSGAGVSGAGVSGAGVSGAGLRR